jgi:hypothetical protein
MAHAMFENLSDLAKFMARPKDCTIGEAYEMGCSVFVDIAVDGITGEATIQEQVRRHNGVFFPDSLADD